MLERKMGAIELGLRCPENVNGILVDPQPDWTFENLLSELDSIDKKLNLGLDFPTPFTKSQIRDISPLKDNNSCGRGFVMHVSDDESDSDEADIKPLVSGGRRFTCDDLYLSDDSDDDMTLVSQYYLMDRAGLAEVALTELTHELQLSVSEEVISKISDLDTELVNKNERFASLTTKIQQNRKLQQERDRKFDLQYRRAVAEALDNHLTAVQRDHEHISQIEERRIRDDAAREEAASKFASETLKTAVENSKGTLGLSSSNDVKKGNLIKASENALELEKRRRQDYRQHGLNIGRRFRTISDSVKNVKIRAEELVKLINNSPECPQFISIRLFAEKIVSNCTNQKSSDAVFATSRVIVPVTSKIPMAMDILIAELNRVCIYTVPKHISYSKEVFNTKDAYYKPLDIMKKMESLRAWMPMLKD